MAQDEGTWEAVREGPYATIRCNGAMRMVELRWTGYAPSADYKEILEQGLEQVRDHGMRLWLADLREMAAILRQDEQWTVTDWFPRLAKAGLVRMAILTSGDLFNQMSVERIMGAADPLLGFPVAYFEDRNGAEEWLMAGITGNG